MRVNRSKFVRKHLRFFRLTFGIDVPFHVILDGNFIFAALKYKIDILERLHGLLQCTLRTNLGQSSEVRLYILKSSISELETVGDTAATSLEYARTCCEIINDDAVNGKTSSEKCIGYLAKLREDGLKQPSQRQRKYILASQDKELRNSVAKIPGVPIIYLNKVVMVLEGPSDASLSFNQKVEMAKVSLNESEEEILALVRKDSKDSSGASSSAQLPKERKKRKATAANPLASMKSAKDSKSTKKKRLEGFRRSK